MAEKTEGATPPAASAESAPAPETQAPQPPAAARASEYLRERPRTRLFLIVAVLVLLVGIFFAWRYFSSYESTDDAEVDGHVMPVSARISGYVAKVNVDDNQYVQAGNVLDAAEAQLLQAQANDVKAQNDLVRYKQLVDKQEISQQLYDQAVAAAAANAAGVAGAKASAAAASQQVTQARSRLSTAQASLRSSQTGPNQVRSVQARANSAEAIAQAKQAALDQAQLNLQYTKILAPATGVVTKNVEVGMNVQPGQQLATVIPLDDIWVTANFKETQLKNMQPGQRAEIKADSNGRVYKAHVDSIAGSSGARLSLLPPENATGNYVKVVQRVPVKIVLEPGENSDHSLRIGMSVEPKVFLK